MKHKYYIVAISVGQAKYAQYVEGLNPFEALVAYKGYLDIAYPFHDDIVKIEINEV